MLSLSDELGGDEKSLNALHKMTQEGLILAQNSLKDAGPVHGEFPQKGFARLSLAQQAKRAF